MSKYEWVKLDDGRSIYRMKDEFRFIPDRHGEAPMVLFDSMEATYHHGICKTIESRREWQEADQLSGSTTVTPKEFKELKERRGSIQRAKERELQADRRKASVEAAKAFNENKEGFYNKLRERGAEQEKQAQAAGFESLIKENI